MLYQDVYNPPIPEDRYGFYISGIYGNYTMQWRDLAISAEVSRFDANGHRLSAEVRINSSRPLSPDDGHIVLDRLELTSASATKTLAGILTMEDPSINWQHLLEQLRVTALSEYRSGSRDILISGEVDVEAQTRWLIHPLVEYKHPSVLYGAGGTGKSWIGLWLSVLVDAGLSHAGLNIEPANVLYLDWETRAEEIASRITMIRRGLNLEGDSNIIYKEMRQSLMADVEAIRDVIRRRDTELVIIDSVISACAGEPTSEKAVDDMFQVLRSLDVSSLLIDHVNKSGELFGSEYKKNEGRQVFEAIKNQREGDDQIIMGLFHKKANNSKIIPPLGFTLNFHNDNGRTSVTIERQDVRQTPLSSHLSIGTQIELLIRKEGAQTIDSITTRLKKFTEKDIRGELEGSKYHSVTHPSGRFAETGNGKWGVAYIEPDPQFP